MKRDSVVCAHKHKPRKLISDCCIINIIIFEMLTLSILLHVSVTVWSLFALGSGAP